MLSAPPPVVKRHNKPKAGVAEPLPTTRAYKDQHLVKERPLSDLQRAAIGLMAQGETAHSAAVRSGMSVPALYTILKRPYVQDILAAERAKYEAASQMTRKKVMDGLLEGIEMAKMMSEPASVISGWREIGKMCGYYEPVRVKLDVNVSGNVVMQQLTKLSDAELLKLIQDGPKAMQELGNGN